MDDRGVAIPELPVEIDTGPLVKDFTGDIRVGALELADSMDAVGAGRGT